MRLNLMILLLLLPLSVSVLAASEGRYDLVDDQTLEGWGYQTRKDLSYRPHKFHKEWFADYRLSFQLIASNQSDERYTLIRECYSNESESTYRVNNIPMPRGLPAAQATEEIAAEVAMYQEKVFEMGFRYGQCVYIVKCDARAWVDTDQHRMAGLLQAYVTNDWSRVLEVNARSGAILRSKPSESGGILTTIKDKSLVVRVGDANDWIRVSTSRNSGYIHASLLEDVGYHKQVERDSKLRLP